MYIKRTPGIGTYTAMQVLESGLHRTYYELVHRLIAWEPKLGWEGPVTLASRGKSRTDIC